MDITKFLRLIKDSRNDSEKFAALLVVAKFVKSDQLTAQARKKVFEAIGFTFINRLLITSVNSAAGDVPQDNPYKKLALTLLACYCTDEELAAHSEVINKIPTFVEVVNSFPSVSVEMFEDTLQCVEALGDVQQGLSALLSAGVSEALGKAYITQKPGSEKAYEVLVKLLHKVQRSGLVFQQAFVSLLNLISHAFKSSHDLFKFDLATSLYRILQLVDPSVFESVGHYQWLSDLRHGLMDVFSSKVVVDQRRSSLHLSSLVCSCVGLEWTIACDNKGQRDTKFLQLFVHLCEVEIHVILNNSMAEIDNDLDFLSACYSAIEATIVYLSKASTDNVISEEDMVKLHQVLSRTLSIVVKFLEQCSTVDDISTLPSSLMVATLRVLGAWLAEDDLSLLPEVCKALPFVLDLALADHNRNCQFKPSPDVQPSTEHCPHVIQFLLPGLIHLTLEEKSRKVIMRKYHHKVIVEYMKYLIGKFSKDKTGDAVEAKLCMCLSVYQNICIAERKVVAKDESFDEVFHSLIPCPFKHSSLNPNSSMHYALTVVLLINVKSQLCSQLDDSVLTAVINYVISVLYNYCAPLHKAPEHFVTADWDELFEVWMICVQELAATKDGNAKVHKIVLDNKHYAKIFGVFMMLQET